MSAIPIPPVAALIFMKGNSVRVPRKNLRPLCGRPTCHWILEALAGSRHIHQIIVNTDSEEIAECVRPLPKVKIHKRPDHLLGDHIGASPIIDWDLQHCDAEYYLQSHSTNPLVTTDTLDRSLEAFFSQSAHDALFSVTEVRKRFYWPDGRAINHDPARLIPTQNLPPIYEENSCIYVFSKAAFRSSGHRLGHRPMLYPMPPLEAVDIDEPHEFRLTEMLMEARLRGLS